MTIKTVMVVIMIIMTTIETNKNMKEEGDESRLLFQTVTEKKNLICN